MEFLFANGSFWRLLYQIQLDRIFGRILHSQLSVHLYLVASGRMMRLWANVENCQQAWMARYREGAGFSPDWGFAALGMNLGQNNHFIIITICFSSQNFIIIASGAVTAWILNTSSLSVLLGKPNGETLKGFYALKVLANCRKFGERQLILAMEIETQAWLSFWLLSRLAPS